MTNFHTYERGSFLGLRLYSIDSQNESAACLMLVTKIG